jgi:AraC-like DNA-binding protein/ligand-binding sensor protein
VHAISFDDLLRLPVVQYYEESFRQATGVVLRIVPPQEPDRRLNAGLPENDFCSLVGSLPRGCESCREHHLRVLKSTAGKLSPQLQRCYAGLTDIAVPVIVGNRHIATLLSGQVLSREPTERDFQMIAGMLDGKDGDWEKRARAAYFKTPVLTAERLEAVVNLLKVFALFLADYVSRFAVATEENEPKPVTTAKQYAHEHIAEAFTLDDVSGKVGVSRFYFCKLFKKATGLTYTDYVTQLRVEKAKVLLVDNSLRITEVAFAAGFGSIPRFNSVIKQHLGMSPTEYRAAMRDQLARN